MFPHRVARSLGVAAAQGCEDFSMFVDARRAVVVTDPAIDLTDLRQLDDTGELLTTLIRHFLDEMPQQLAVMQAAVQRGQAVMLAETAHALKGSSGNLGAGRMQQLWASCKPSAKPMI